MMYKHNPSITAFEAVFWKSITMMVFNFFFVKMHGEFILNIPARYHRLIIIRSFVGFLGVQGLFNSVKFMPVSQASVIFFTGPLIAALMAFFYLKERITIFDIACLICSFVGVILINNPFRESVAREGDNKIIGSAFAIIGAFGAASAWLCMRIMSKDIHFSISPFYFSLGATFFSPAFAIMSVTANEHTTIYDLKTVVLLLAASFVSFIGQVYQSKAYQIEKTARVAAMNYI